jgi:uncharacterized membrane protein YphA (DoxX/SURF4 family)
MTTNETRGQPAPILLILGRLALAGIFLFAAYAKLKPQAAMPWSGASIRTSLSMFAMQVDSYQLLPPQLVSPAAHFLPMFELFLGLWLLSGVWLRYSSLVTTLLLGAFFAMMAPTAWAWKSIADASVPVNGSDPRPCSAMVPCWHSRWR